MERPKELQERVFVRLFEQAEIAKYTPEEYSAYEDSLVSLWDIANSNEAAEQKGAENKAKEIALSLKALGTMPIAQIAEITKLTLDEINSL